ncbi:DNA-binding domain of ModE / Molybdate-binding domain of ModE [Halarchaeum acidiphilum MH1-52-1]|uniref:DNA-binding domain of ModE / Molybdate-binding domain of ModE n=1 Tax=Halarchaeum acidiphilum MH1-52-1 TaxID=1261545 RepID=U3A555_9EURY|nr:TOBE domain-containing protein [Halarchaeum acidiphilum]GAD52774.1 DNA-binding domain of ModE / Molybdate-binding domain of ModE [Halarchaeum acidiphilum MH1-52-1]
MDADAGFDARLHGDDVAFGARDAALLRAIDDAGSLNAASERLGRSYSRAHERLGALEDAFGPLVERTRGGPSGGGTTLTEEARTLLARFERLRTGYAATAETTAAVLDGTVTERTGELGVVDTDAGEIRALVPPDADRVEVSVRADAVTLHDPDATPTADATSARNRFEGVVTAVESGDAVARVVVDVGADTPLDALLTTDSVERLAVEPGRRVVASFKATATRATPTET